MKKYVFLIAITSLAACTTPATTLKNSKTGQVVTCGGSATGSFVGGAIGYHVQKDNDQNCVNTYKKQGFKIIDKTE
jgi:phage tail tape-measure protein